ncbi:MAG: hypothetical protein U9N51_12070 [Bacteroidota bacterium]|nr:hypothetical protein [Bacteroidota bacterium]
MYIVVNGTGTLYYTVTDHLGSIIQLIDANGTVIEETNYGPWGRYRNPDTWQYDNTASLSMIHRGYTGHQMLNEFDLIHMNGRMYDIPFSAACSPPTTTCKTPPTRKTTTAMRIATTTR